MRICGSKGGTLKSDDAVFVYDCERCEEVPCVFWADSITAEYGQCRCQRQRTKWGGCRPTTVKAKNISILTRCVLINRVPDHASDRESRPKVEPLRIPDLIERWP